MKQASCSMADAIITGFPLLKGATRETKALAQEFVSQVVDLFGGPSGTTSKGGPRWVYGGNFLAITYAAHKSKRGALTICVGARPEHLADLGLNAKLERGAYARCVLRNAADLANALEAVWRAYHRQCGN